jgi:hypothetical protein
MEQVWFLAALWLGLALVATLLSIWFRISTALTEMSTGLTFGTISALFGLNHGIINQSQYSHLVATGVASAVISTAIANAYFMPKHLLPTLGRSAKVPPKAIREPAVK